MIYNILLHFLNRGVALLHKDNTDIEYNGMDNYKYFDKHIHIHYLYYFEFVELHLKKILFFQEKIYANGKEMNVQNEHYDILFDYSFRNHQENDNDNHN